MDAFERVALVLQNRIYAERKAAANAKRAKSKAAAKAKMMEKKRDHDQVEHEMLDEGQ